MARWIVVGATGQLGRAFVKKLKSQNDDVVALNRDLCDLARPETLQLPEGEASAVINCAAYTDVDGAESSAALAHRVNGEAVGVLAELCRARDLRFVHFSTDYVFDGEATSPYAVDATRNPINEYGRSKATGEELLEKSGASYLMLRASWVYAPWGNNFVRTMARLMAERDTLRVVNDQRGSPTHVDTLVDATLGLLKHGATGTFHRSDAGECSWYEYACFIAEQLGSSCQVDPCTSAEFPRPARRPAYSVLDGRETDVILGPASPYQDRVQEVLRR